MLNPKTKLKVYFYNGLEAPRLVARNIKKLHDITIYSTYHGNMTDQLQETIANCRDIADLTEELPYYDLYVNPTLSAFREANKAWFPADSLNTHLDDFIDSAK